MAEFWETAFVEKSLMWGLEPTASALLAADDFARAGVKHVLVPGIGYGRNAKPFLERGMTVTGIEISETAIALARSKLGLTIPIHHGSVSAMPFDDREYDGIFAYGLMHLLDATARAKLVRDCHRQLAVGGRMFFSLLSKEAPMYGQGPKLGEDWYERLPGLPMFFYDEASAHRELDAYGLVELARVDEGSHGGSLPFVNAICTKR